MTTQPKGEAKYIAGVCVILAIALVVFGVVVIPAIFNFILLAKFNTNKEDHTHNKNVIYCGSIGTGIGIGGSLAFALKSLSEKETLCVIERNDRFGGRIEDYEDEKGRKIGLTVLRFLDSHSITKLLADFFKIPYQKNIAEWGKAYTRGQYFYRHTNIPELDRKMCQLAFRNLTCEYDGFSDPSVGMFVKLLEEYESNPSIVEGAADFMTFLQKRWGQEAFEFVRANIRYASNFINTYSTKPMLEFYKNEMGFDPVRYYPVGGMSAFTDNLAKVIRKNKARIFLNEEVLKIEKDDAGYVVTTTNHLPW